MFLNKAAHRALALGLMLIYIVPLDTVRVGAYLACGQSIHTN